MRVEVEILDDERTSTPAVFKDLDNVSPTCCCSESLDRCGRCDLLFDLEGFHLMSVARTLQALVRDVESRNQLVGCPGCGVIAQGNGRVVVEVIHAPWAGVPARIRWHKRRWICREHTCETVTFLERSDKVCAPINTQGKPGAHTKPDAALSSGELHYTGSDTPATHCTTASCSAKPPPLPAWRALQGPHTWPERQQARKNSPIMAPPPAFPRKNSPNAPENSVFRPFWACRANFFALPR